MLDPRSPPPIPRPSPRERPDRAVGNAPTAIRAMREDVEPRQGQLESIGRADSRAEAAKNANVPIDLDHDD